MKSLLQLWVLCVLLAGCAGAPMSSVSDAVQQVMTVERAFAQTMADRDLEGFASFIDEEAVFLAGDDPLRGKAQIVAGWTRYFADPAAPFSWQPDRVEVLDSGNLAYSTGPVRNAEGVVVARFNSIWRRDANGHWRVVFDKGNKVCDERQGQSN